MSKVACLAIAFLLFGCGQKGDLYLPDQSHSTTPATPVIDDASDSPNNY